MHLRRRFTLPLPGGRTLALGDRPLVMGIVNVTPDSFSDGGRYLDPVAAVASCRELLEEGADLLDLGGESTRPGSPDGLAFATPPARSHRHSSPRQHHNRGKASAGGRHGKRRTKHGKPMAAGGDAHARGA